MLFCYVSYKYKTMYILKAVHNTRHYTNIQNVKIKKILQFNAVKLLHTAFLLHYYQQ